MHVMSVSLVTTYLGGLRLYGSYTKFAAQFVFSSEPVLDVLPRFTAALKIQRISYTRNFFVRWFSAFGHGELLGCLAGYLKARGDSENFRCVQEN